MSQHKLSAEKRKIIGRKVKALRKSGFLPANIFGKDVKSATIQIKAVDFTKFRKEAGESTLVYLSLEGEEESRPVMIHEIAIHPVNGQILHIDFHQVNLSEKTTALISVKLTGDSPAEKEKLGILVQQLDEVEVEAFPADMPEHLEVSVETLSAVGDSIRVLDIKPGSKLIIKTDPDSIVAKIEALAKEEVVEAPAPVEGEVPADVVPSTESPATQPQSTSPENPTPSK